jgi:hypothetical protein
MSREGLKRFLSLVPNMSVDDAQQQADMSDTEIEELVDICSAVLDSEKHNASLYDLSVLKRLDRIERDNTQRATAIVQALNGINTSLELLSGALLSFVRLVGEHHERLASPGATESSCRCAPDLVAKERAERAALTLVARCDKSPEDC